MLANIALMAIATAVYAGYSYKLAFVPATIFWCIITLLLYFSAISLESELALCLYLLILKLGVLHTYHWSGCRISISLSALLLFIVALALNLTLAALRDTDRLSAVAPLWISEWAWAAFQWRTVEWRTMNELGQKPRSHFSSSDADDYLAVLHFLEHVGFHNTVSAMRCEGRLKNNEHARLAFRRREIDGWKQATRLAARRELIYGDATCELPVDDDDDEVDRMTV